MIAFNSKEAEHYRKEIYKIRKCPGYFLDTYCHIFDATSGEWVPFRLWPAQLRALQKIHGHRLTVILKARQLGLTWLVLGFALWLMLFYPAATILLFSRRDEEATDMLKVRLRGMYDRLPDWLQVQFFETDNDHEWQWSNGSRCLAFPTTGGDSYTATLVIIDEADLVPDLAKLMSSVKPTIDAGGRMILVSRVDKTRPQSPFKRIYAGAKQKKTEWEAIFLPWFDRPDRDKTWYEAQQADILHRTESLDDLHEQYPTTDAQALLPRTLNKRIAPEWIDQCYEERSPLRDLPASTPAIPGLEVYVPPKMGRFYVIGADPAEGNPTSDDSALTVLDRDTGEEVASLAGKLQTSTLAAHIDTIGKWYNNAAIMVERNNHGHAVLLWLRDHSLLWLMPGHDGQEGWLTNSKGKALLYSAVADAFRERQTFLHSFATVTQLASIEGSTLRAPEGEADDSAVSYALACVASQIRSPEHYKGALVLWPDVPMPSEQAEQKPQSGSRQVFEDVGIDLDGDWGNSGGGSGLLDGMPDPFRSRLWR